MDLQLVSPTKSEQLEWDAFLQTNKGLCFSSSSYLNATAENWMLVYNSTKTGGMACPYVVKMGQKMLVTPFFCRYVEWVGDPVPQNELITFLRSQFQVADIQIRANEFEQPTKIHQELKIGTVQLNQQAKRSLKKAARFQITTTFSPKTLMDLIHDELTPKIDSIHSYSLSKLQSLVESLADNNQLIQLNCLDGSNWVGGLWLIKDADRLIYLKGTVCQVVRKEGAMYLLIYQAIQMAYEKQLIFDFGGSNVQNVRRFNLHFGAQDIVYSQLKWNDAPFYWKLLKFLKKQWNKK